MSDGLISFVGAGPGAADLITIRGADRLGQADVVIWASSLVPEALLAHARPGAEVHDSATMTLEDVLGVYEHNGGRRIVRLHSGDPALYGAIQEQIDWCEAQGRRFEIVPGVSSLAAAAAAIGRELTIPTVAQSVVVTRLAGRTKASMPPRETLSAFSAIAATTAVFLSGARPRELQEELLGAGSAWTEDTPAAVVVRVSWPDEQVILTTVGQLADTIVASGHTRTVLVLVGDVLAPPNGVAPARSHLYSPKFAHTFRKRSLPGTTTGRAVARRPGAAGRADRSGQVTYEPELSEDVAARRKGLRTGWTTGTCASAAAKAAAIGLVNGAVPGTVEVALPGGLRVSFDVEVPAVPAGSPPAGSSLADGSPPARSWTAVVVKDAGDDPDCTDGARMTATVELAANPAMSGSEPELRAGPGVGVVTKPGLGLPVGAPAINPVPRRMIAQAIAEVTDRPLVVTFSVPGGAEMAAETTNDRLGILGGISILGTTGIVRPFSTAAYRASVVQQIDVAAAQGERHVVLATGHRSEALASHLLPSLDPVCFVEVGDFTGIALRRAAAKGVQRLHLVAMTGKLTKLASGVMMTHFHRTDVDTNLLADIAAEAGSDERLRSAATETATARHFAEVAIEVGDLRPLAIVCERARTACMAHAGGKLDVSVWMSDFEGERVLAWAGEPPPPVEPR